MQSYKDLDLWKESINLVIEIYAITKLFPKEEIYGLVSQLRRCAVSIPSNIAEGSGRKNTKEFIQFLWIANGSISEVETQIEIAKRLNYFNEDQELINKIKHIRKMLLGLISALESKLPK